MDKILLYYIAQNLLIIRQMSEMEYLNNHYLCLSVCDAVHCLNDTTSYSKSVWTFNLYTDPRAVTLPNLKISNAVQRWMHMLHSIHCAHVTHMQITWYCLYITFSWPKCPVHYGRLSQQQRCFLLKFKNVFWLEMRVPRKLIFCWWLWMISMIVIGWISERVFGARAVPIALGREEADDGNFRHESERLSN